MPLPVNVLGALALMRLAQQASGPSGFRAFSLVVHFVLRTLPARPYGARVGSEWWDCWSWTESISGQVKEKAPVVSRG